MSSNKRLTVGNISEYQAIVKCLEEGYNVYKNVESTGEIDLIVESRETKKLLRVDVKRLDYSQDDPAKTNRGAKLRENQKGYPDDGIVILVVDADGHMWIQGYIKDKTREPALLQDRFRESMRQLGMDVSSVPIDKYHQPLVIEPLIEDKLSPEEERLLQTKPPHP
jgi:hypothetical protein|tara:strand:+ start:2249 stop:2746 length:498 start_codon:yes stop_codon:yes gene_type:complete